MLQNRRCPPCYLYLEEILTRAAPCKNDVSLGTCGQRRPRSDCASAQSDQGLPCPLIESLDTTECLNEEQRPIRYIAYAQYNLNLRILHILEGTFSLGVAHLISMHFKYPISDSIWMYFGFLTSVDVLLENKYFHYYLVFLCETLALRN